MCKNLDSPHPLTPSPKDGRRGTRMGATRFCEVLKPGTYKGFLVAIATKKPGFVDNTGV